MRTGIIYTETVVHVAPERFAADAPYQVAIVELEEGGRITARIEGPRVARSEIASVKPRRSMAFPASQPLK